MNRSILCTAAVLLGSVVLAAGQNPKSHDVGASRGLSAGRSRPWFRGCYAEHCDRCHGADGNGVAGVDLRSGKFRTATTDNQLRTVITNGFPTAGMPPFKLDPADLAGLVAYLRNMNSIDRRLAESWQCG